MNYTTILIWERSGYVDRVYKEQFEIMAETQASPLHCTGVYYTMKEVVDKLDEMTGELGYIKADGMTYTGAYQYKWVGIGKGV